MWAIILEYTNHQGNTRELYIPMFNSAPECLWWLDYIWNGLLKPDGAHDAVKATCKFFATKELG